jgi:ABC-2 type transport system permease protein
VSADANTASGQLSTAAVDGRAGEIHNIGYRRYDGARLGRVQIVRALMWHSFRGAYGFGRGAKAKIFPMLLFALMCLPAAVNAVALANNPSGGAIVSYDGYVPSLRAIVMLIFVALQAPNMVSADLRNHTLPLYFARPIGRNDYPIAKLAAFVLACLAIIEIPLLVLYLGNVTQQHGASEVWAQTRQLGSGLLYGAAWAVLLASIGLLLASLTGRRVFAICAVGIPLFFSYILANALTHIGQVAYGPAGFGQPSMLSSLAGLISPFTLLGGLLHWLQGSPATTGQFRPNDLQRVIIGTYGPWYGLVFVLLLVAAVGGLVARYRKVGVA